MLAADEFANKVTALAAKQTEKPASSFEWEIAQNMRNDAMPASIVAFEGGQLRPETGEATLQRKIDQYMMQSGQHLLGKLESIAADSGAEAPTKEEISSYFALLAQRLSVQQMAIDKYEG